MEATVLKDRDKNWAYKHNISGLFHLKTSGGGRSADFSQGGVHCKLIKCDPPLQHNQIVLVTPLHCNHIVIFGSLIHHNSIFSWRGVPTLYFNFTDLKYCTIAVVWTSIKTYPYCGNTFVNVNTFKWMQIMIWHCMCVCGWPQVCMYKSRIDSNRSCPCVNPPIVFCCVWPSELSELISL